MTADPSWVVEHHRGSAADFHARAVPDEAVRSVWWFEVEAPTVVLGSTQADDVVDRGRVTHDGVQVVRRRSGGGAVWLAPGVVTWVDLVIPASDPLWSADVSRSSAWVGEVWARCLRGLGTPDATVHAGGMVDGPWSRLVCFAGLGPGEVTVAGRKVVGVSQRRTRGAARFQCAVLHRWDPAPLLAVLALADGEREQAAHDLAHVAAGVPDVTPARLHDAFEAALPT